MDNDLADLQNIVYLGKLIEIGFAAKDHQNTTELCRKYLLLEQNSAVHYALGTCLGEIGQTREAIYHLEIAFNAGYNVVNTLEKLCYSAHGMSDTDRIHQYCTEYLKLTDADENRRVAYMILDKLFINGFMVSLEKISTDRQNFDESLTDLLISGYTVTDIDKFTSPWTVKMGFPLSYHHRNNCDIYKKLSCMYRTLCPDLNYRAKHFTNKPKTPNAGQKLKVGFVSAFFRDHSVAKDRRGIIKLLDRDKYEVYTLFIGDMTDHISAEIRQYACTTHVNLNDSIIVARDQIACLELDILVYCEIGMSMLAYLLSHLRLAPVQINTWGHSDTSGVSTVDYFVSSRLYEMPSDSQDHYSEKLILNDGLCTYYYNPIRRLTQKPFQNQFIMDTFGDKHRYACLGTSIKLHPIMDTIFKKLLDTDKDAIIIMIDDGQHRHKYEQRLKIVIGENICRIGFIPGACDPDYFTSIMMASHVILDTYPFGGCNTSLEAFSIGKPVVTLPGEFLNGRFTYGFYTKMGLTELIAKDIDDYVNIAVKLASDQVYRDRIYTEISVRSAVLYENMESVREWDEMLMALYNEKTRAT